MKDRPQPEVLAWVDDQLADALFITTITEAEIRAGIAVLPDGQRRRDLLAAAEHVFGVSFAERILPFDSEAARAYGFVAAGRRAAGRLISTHDCLIAAITRFTRSCYRNEERGRFRRLRGRDNEPVEHMTGA